mgnify:CR=1 FL=1
MTKAVAYYRVSTKMQADSGLGLEAQRSAIEGYCEMKGWEIFRRYADEGVSGGDDDRGGLNAAVEHCSESEEPCVLVAYSLDRLGRNLMNLMKLVELSEERGFVIATVNQELDPYSPYGKALFQMQGAFAELEKAMASERTSNAIQAKLARGETWGPEPNQNVDPIALEKILEWDKNRLTLRQICHTLQSMGFTTSTGNTKWQPSTVRKIIEREKAKREQDQS